MLGTTEIIIIALVVVLLFGASSIPKIAKSLGQAKNEFEKGFKNGSSRKEINQEKKTDIENKN